MRNRFAGLHVVFNTLGSLLIILVFFLFTPLLISYVYDDTRNFRILFAFVIPILLSFALGILFRIALHKGNPSGPQAMLIYALSWIICSAIRGLPFVIGLVTSFINGLFEAMSGFTTTGIKMFTGLDEMPISLIFWRSLTQGIGGFGIQTLFLVAKSNRFYIKSKAETRQDW